MGNMNKQEIEQQLLMAAYEAHFSGEVDIQLRTVINVDDAHDDELRSVVLDLLGEKKFMRASGRGPFASPADTYRITGSGIIHCEHNGLVPKEVAEHNAGERMKILEAVVTWREQTPFDAKDSNSWGISLPELSLIIGTPENSLKAYISALYKLGYTEITTLASLYEPTESGKQAVRQYRLEQQYEHISALRPQERGRELQRLIAEIAAQQGWEQKEGVRTQNEEIDVIVYHETNFFLIECKWEKKPIQRKVISDLQSKLNKRAGAVGCLVSMSGFTVGTISEVRELSSQYSILLFGKADVESMVYGRKSLRSLILTKLGALTTSRQVIFSQ